MHTDLTNSAAGRWLSAAAIVFFCAGLQAAPPEKITEVEGVTEYRLDNGFKVLFVPDAGRPRIGINIVYFVGSKHEGYGESGMAHLLEHMLFYGTSDHPDIRREIAERGGVANATTALDRTNYVQFLPAGDENLEWAIRMEADRMTNATIAAADLATEMAVVRNELEHGENSTFRVLMQRVTGTAYTWHGYGRPTIGSRSDLKYAPIGRLREFYRRHYQPDNAMLVVSGNFDQRLALELISRHFGAIPAPDRTGGNFLWSTYTDEPDQDGAREVAVRRVGDVQMIMSAFHVPAVLHEDFPAVEVLAYILGNAPSGRLHEALVETGMAARVLAHSQRLAEPGLLYLFAEVGKNRDVEAVKDAFLDTVGKVISEPPSGEEVARAINAIKRDIDQTLNDTDRIGMTLPDWAAGGDWRLMFLHRDRVEAITPADVVRVANAYLKPANRTLGLLLPVDEPVERAEIPQTPAAEAVLAGYTGRDHRSAGEAFAATAANIETRTSRFTLANGTRVALLPKRSRGGRVNLALTMRIGNEDRLRGQGYVPEAARALLTRGTRDYTRQQLSDYLDELQTTLDIQGRPNTVTASLETGDGHLAEVLDLLAEMLRRPGFPPDEVDEWRHQELAAVNGRRNDPSAVGSQLLSRHFEAHDRDHPFYSPGFDERIARIEAVTRDRLVAFHRQFYGFGSATSLAVVGDFDPQAVRRHLDTLFSDWSPNVAFERIADSGGTVAPARLHAELDDKPGALLMARQNIGIRDDHPDYPALMLGGHLLGGGFLSSRLVSRVRVQEGISYAIGAGFSIDAIDESGRFNIRAMFNPGNRDRLNRAILTELEDVLSDGFDEDELDAAKHGWLQREKVLRSDDGQLAALLNDGLYLDRDMFYHQELESRVLALTTEDIAEALRRHLDISSLSFVEVGNFSVAAP